MTVPEVPFLSRGPEGEHGNGNKDHQNKTRDDFCRRLPPPLSQAQPEIGSLSCGHFSARSNAKATLKALAGDITQISRI
jgi:hypothetical protein